MPVVSAIITTFNRSKYLGKAVASVLGQAFEDFESQKELQQMLSEGQYLQLLRTKDYLIFDLRKKMGQEK